MSEYQQGKDMAQCLARLDRIEAALSSYHDESPPSERTSPLFDGEAELTAVLGEDLLPIADRDILNLYRGFEFNYSVSKPNFVNEGYWFDHKWYTYLAISGYVIDDKGTLQKWNHIAIGFEKGYGCKYPNHPHDRVTDTDKKRFMGSTKAKYRINEWSGWVEVKNNKHTLIFHWNNKKG